MKSKKGFALSVLLVFFICGVTIPLFMTNHTKVKAETITDLTGTTWTFNETITVGLNGPYMLNFTSNNNNYTTLAFVMNANRMSYNNTLIYYNGWQLQDIEYRTITISGGNEATQSALITWLQNNATQQTTPTPPTDTQISHRYWSIATGFRMNIDEYHGDNDIEYTVLFNEQRRSFDETIQTGLVFRGPVLDDNTCYMWAINGTGINLLYRSEDDRFLTSCWFEFTPGDYIDTDLYDFMSLIGHWFDDGEAYLCGTNQGWAEGVEHGRALGQADGVEYTGLITGIFNGLGNILSIQVFPNITIGLLIGLPLLLGAFIIIIKILRG